MGKTYTAALIAALLGSTALPIPAGAQQSTEGSFAYAPELAPETPADLRDELSAQTPVASLSAALRRAYWGNPTLQAQRAAVRGVDWRVPQARAAYGPRLSASGSYGWQRDNFETAPGDYTPLSGWSTTAQAVLTQPLFTFGRNAAAEQFALAQREFQGNVLRSSEQQTMLDAITAYVAVLRDRAGVGIAQDNLDLLERELVDNQARLKAREVTSSDLQQVETRVDLGRAQVLSAKRAIAGSEALFVRVIGAPASPAAAAPNPLSLPVRTLEEAYAYAEAHNPVLFAAQAREKVSRAQVASARADLAPRVDLRAAADYGTTSPYSNTLRQNTLRGEVLVTAPLFESGLRRSRVSEAEALNDADWRLMDAAMRENRAAIADAWSDWQAQTGAIARLGDAVESARKAYDGALLQERAGLRTTLDVLDLARELLSARSSYNSAIANATIAKARLLAAMGSLEYGWLLPDEARYDADGHFQDVRRKGDVPLLTPLFRAIDHTVAGGGAPRPLRDPSAKVATPGFTLTEGPDAQK
ncbi:TolC family outer membrane protein [Novosphingobium jiangmenense]|uniref:TolC family outer membrane protein n=1 Tax=Novosphingobium jiangmenense TaxID=2791981 RepID=A0ABS0HJE2_9SPHN|nr:TolC family outer membrane protein [Novosphingobium jiangmenense]MBF9152121.1 TolC family outer membrane protein [Novosphingobium jiangmenense]